MKSPTVFSPSKFALFLFVCVCVSVMMMTTALAQYRATINTLFIPIQIVIGVAWLHCSEEYAREMAPARGVVMLLGVCAFACLDSISNGIG